MDRSPTYFCTLPKKTFELVSDSKPNSTQKLKSTTTFLTGINTPSILDKAWANSQKLSNKKILLPKKTYELDLSLEFMPPKPVQDIIKPRFFPVRSAELDLPDLEPTPQQEKKTARKRLWSVEKTNVKRFSTIMKANKDVIRRSVVNKPLPSKTVTFKNPPKMRTSLFNGPQKPQSSSKLTYQPKSFSNAKNKPVLKPILETSNNSTLDSRKSNSGGSKANKSKTTMNNSNKNNAPSRSNTELVSSISSANLDLIVQSIPKILDRLTSLESLLKEKFECKNCGCRAPLSPCKKETKPTLEPTKDELNLSFPADCSYGLSKLSLETTTPHSDPKQESTDSNKEEVTNEVGKPVNKLLQNCKESQYENFSPSTLQLQFSDEESPFAQHLDLDFVISENDKQSPFPLTKSLSTSSLNQCDSDLKNSIYKAKSQPDEMSQRINDYNTMKNSCRFLSTPKITRNGLNLMTPSIKNSHKKMMSRRVQEQLLMLDKNV